MKITRSQLRRIIIESYKSWDVTRAIFGDYFRDDYRSPINPDVSSDFKPALLITPYGENSIIFVLWRPKHKSIMSAIPHEQSEIMAMIHVKPTKKPCIPVTYEIAQSAVNPNLAGEKGYGALIYGIVFQHMKEKGFGLTSDHSVSSSNNAKSLWNRYADTKSFEKRKTAAGNDDFDYYGKTPDENDDCDLGDGIEYMATHNSWITTSDNYRNIRDSLFNQSSDYFRSLQPDKRGKLKTYLITSAFEMFHNALSV